MLLAVVSLIIQLIVIHRIITHGGPVQCIPNTLTYQ
jgi:hypothetical protein